jgi:hypothetical protein
MADMTSGKFAIFCCLVNGSNAICNRGASSPDPDHAICRNTLVVR